MLITTASQHMDAAFQKARVNNNFLQAAMLRARDMLSSQIAVLQQHNEKVSAVLPVAIELTREYRTMGRIHVVLENHDRA